MHLMGMGLKLHYVGKRGPGYQLHIIGYTWIILVVGLG